MNEETIQRNRYNFSAYQKTNFRGALTSGKFAGIYVYTRDYWAYWDVVFVCVFFPKLQYPELSFNERNQKP